MIASGWLALLPTLAVVAAAILLRSTLPALVVGVLAIRTRGIYFAMVTMALSQ